MENTNGQNYLNGVREKLKDKNKLQEPHGKEVLYAGEVTGKGKNHSAAINPSYVDVFNRVARTVPGR